MNFEHRLKLCLMLLTLAVGPCVCVGPLMSDEPVTYQTHIKKLFRTHCGACHNATREEAGLDLMSYAGAMRGSASGEILVKGDPADSFLYLTVTHVESPVMPPGKNKLDDESINLIKSWIELGLPNKPADVKMSSSNSANGATGPSKDKLAGNSELGNKQPDFTKPEAPRSLDVQLATSPVFQGEHRAPITAMAVSPSGKWAALGGQLQVLIFDLQTFQLAGVLPYPEGEVKVIRFDQNGKFVFAGGGVAAESGIVVGWQLSTGQRVLEIGDEFDTVLALDVSPDDSSILIGGPGRTLKLIDIDSGKTKSTITKHTDWVLSASFNPEGLIFTSADRAGNVFVWESDSGADLHTLRGHRGAVNCIEWRDNGDQCISAGLDGTVRIWDMHTGEQLRSWVAHESGVLAMSCDRSGQLATVGRDGFLKTWSSEGAKVSSIEMKRSPLQIQFVDQATVLVGFANGDSQVWNIQSGSLIESLTVPANLLTNDTAALAKPKALVKIAKAAAENSSEVRETLTLQNRLLEITDRLPLAVEALNDAKRELSSAENRLQELKSQPGSKATESKETKPLLARVAQYEQLIATLTLALKQANDIEENGVEGAVAHDLTELALNKTVAALKQVKAELAVVEQGMQSKTEIAKASKDYKTAKAKVETARAKLIDIRTEMQKVISLVDQSIDESEKIDRR